MIRPWIRFFVLILFVPDIETLGCVGPPGGQCLVPKRSSLVSLDVPTAIRHTLRNQLQADRLDFTALL